MNDHDRQSEQFERRLQQWGAQEQARRTDAKAMPPVPVAPRMPLWVWGAPVAIAAGLAIVICVASFWKAPGHKDAPMAAAPEQEIPDIASLVAERDQLQDDLAEMTVARDAAVQAMEAEQERLAMARDLVGQLIAREQRVETSNRDAMAKQVELLAAAEAQLADARKATDDAEASADALQAALMWNADTLADCQGKLRREQLISRGRALRLQYPDSSLAELTGSTEVLLLKLSLLGDDPESLTAFAASMESATILSRLELAMAEYRDEDEAFLWLAQTHAVLSETCDLA